MHLIDATGCRLAARREGISHAALEAAGLVTRNEETGLTHDRFRGRLIFPIHDMLGRVLGFGGRILPEAERGWAEQGRRAAKYLNSPETAIFQKRKQLYAADLARAAARQEGWVVVVEGYTDVIAAHQSGLENVVGTLGTALGDDHVLQLRRLADRVVLVFDGDEAGQKAADRALELFLSHALDMRVLTLPGGVDPCDFLLSEGAEAFRDARGDGHRSARFRDPASHRPVRRGITRGNAAGRRVGSFGTGAGADEHTPRWDGTEGGQGARYAVEAATTARVGTARRDEAAATHATAGSGASRGVANHEHRFRAIDRINPNRDGFHCREVRRTTVC